VHIVVVVAEHQGPPDRHMVGQAASVAVSALRERGHTVDVLDLVSEGFRPVMSAEERRAYFTHSPVLDPLVQRHVDLVRQTDGLVLVYPSTLSMLSPMMKGWLERVLVPGVAFTQDPVTESIHRGFTQLRHIVGIATYEDSWWQTKRIHDNGRRVLLRNLRLCAGLRTRSTWLPMYSAATAHERDCCAYLRKVEQRMASL
jgi:NAD(P)H dehydrogenase (quinone)